MILGVSHDGGWFLDILETRSNIGHRFSGRCCDESERTPKMWLVQKKSVADKLLMIETDVNLSAPSQIRDILNLDINSCRKYCKSCPHVLSLFAVQRTTV
jgi:hypothetical protein